MQLRVGILEADMKALISEGDFGVVVKFVFEANVSKK